MIFSSEPNFLRFDGINPLATAEKNPWLLRSLMNFQGEASVERTHVFRWQFATAKRLLGVSLKVPKTTSKQIGFSDWHGADDDLIWYHPSRFSGFRLRITLSNFQTPKRSVLRIIRSPLTARVQMGPFFGGLEILSFKDSMFQQLPLGEARGSTCYAKSQAELLWNEILAKWIWRIEKTFVFCCWARGTKISRYFRSTI